MFQHFIGRVFLFHEPPIEELRFIDFPVFSQGSVTPNSILVQMDDADLTGESRTRIEQFKSQDLLPLELLKEQAIFEPEDLLHLAEAVASLNRSDAAKLAWQNFPTYEQLEFCAGLL